MVQQLAPEATLRNYAKEGLSRAEVEQILKAVPSTADVMNARHATARANGWNDAAPSKAAFVKAAVLENNLLRRPILLRGSTLVVGKDGDAIRELLG